MKRFFALTLLRITRKQFFHRIWIWKSYNKGYTMTYGVGTHIELDQANQRINTFKEQSVGGRDAVDKIY